MSNPVKHLIKFCIVLLTLYSCVSADNSSNDSKSRPNVLFIAIDDLRPELGCYGEGHIYSPNIDALAKESVLFDRHYVQVATCGASRYSMLTGTLPSDKSHLYNDAIVKHISEKNGELSGPETFVEHFKNSGYYTIGLGKISHSADGYVYGYREPKSNQRELPNSWSDLDFNPGQWGNGWNAFFAYANGVSREPMNKQVKPYEKGEVDDKGYPDGLLAELAIEKLKDAAKMDGPFFMGVGFFKPHLPFTAPKKYWDLYDRSTIELAPYDSLPLNSHPSSLQNMGEFNGYKAGVERASLEEPLSDDYARLLRHGYFASISYTDAQVGKLITELKDLGLYENTVIVMWGDHGYNLGDHRVWGKHTLLEKSVRSAFLIKDAGQKEGKLSSQIVSSVDIYPTLIELCGLEALENLDGESMVPILHNRNIETKNRAYSYWRNGMSLRTVRYRLNRYYREDGPQYELYDYETDPHESKNIAEENMNIVAQLKPLLEEGNTGVFK